MFTHSKMQLFWGALERDDKWRGFQRVLAQTQFISDKNTQTVDLTGLEKSAGTLALSNLKVKA